jgi:hypothetical protein
VRSVLGRGIRPPTFRSGLDGHVTRCIRGGRVADVLAVKEGRSRDAAHSRPRVRGAPTS